jgi:membrane-associated phospholipid phosphatase
VYRLVLALTFAAAGPARAQAPTGPWLLPEDCTPTPLPYPVADDFRFGPRAEAAVPRDLVLRWNEETLAAVRAERTPPPVAARNLAVVHVAVYDAVNAVAGTYRPFRVRPDAPADASPEAAAAAAAHRTLAALYPRRAGRFDAALAASLRYVPEGPGKAGGIAVGRAVAEEVLRWRAADLDARPVTYTPRDEPGRWWPTPPDCRPPLLPGWASVPCFALPTAGEFRPPGPPALTSEAYAASYRRVMALGAAGSRVRTRDQTEVAFFWADGEGTVTPPGHWNRIAQTVAAARGLTVVENARLFAALNVALADAAIACWECKYGSDFWRPVTAVRAAGRLGGPALSGDACWSPLLPTPPFPSYTSGHSTFSGAAAAVLADFFGTDAVRFASTSDGLPGVVRSYLSFTAAAEEAGLSRIYGGIHWDFDNADGLACGRKVGEYVSRHFFRPPATGRAGGVPASFAIRRRPVTP